MKNKLEQLVHSMAEPAINPSSSTPLRFSPSDSRLEICGRRLLWRLQLPSQALARQVIDVLERPQQTVQIRVKQLKRVETWTLGEALPLVEECRAGAREEFQKMIEALIGLNFRGVRIAESRMSADLSHSISGQYLRLQFSWGGKRWAALAAGPEAGQETVNELLAQGLIWRKYLQSLKKPAPEQLLLLAPAGETLVLKSRLGWIRGASRVLQLMEMDAQKKALEFVDLSDSGNIDTGLSEVEACQRQDFSRLEIVKRVVQLAPRNIETIWHSGQHAVGFRIRGLEFARLSLHSGQTLWFGVEEPVAVHSPADWAALTRLAARILQQRQAGARNQRHPYYRQQGERWLESLILQNIRLIDPQLDPRFVYPQVPMFLGGDRGVVDILCLTRQRRLAVLELKISENIELPMQGLDYWLRVRHHLRRGEFSRGGYFQGVALSSDDPLLYFVAPQFCYHSTFPQILDCISADVPVIQVGINQDWRSGVRVVLRRSRGAFSSAKANIGHG